MFCFSNSEIILNSHFNLNFSKIVVVYFSKVKINLKVFSRKFSKCNPSNNGFLTENNVTISIGNKSVLRKLHIQIDDVSITGDK